MLVVQRKVRSGDLPSRFRSTRTITAQSVTVRVGAGVSVTGPG